MLKSINRTRGHFAAHAANPPSQLMLAGPFLIVALVLAVLLTLGACHKREQRAAVAPVPQTADDESPAPDRYTSDTGEYVGESTDDPDESAALPDASGNEAPSDGWPESDAEAPDQTYDEESQEPADHGDPAYDDAPAEDDASLSDDSWEG